MKTKKYFILIISMIMINANTFAKFVDAKIKVTGITCSMCSNSVNKALLSLKFVDKVEVDLEKAIFTVKFKAEEKVIIDELKNKIEGAGFSVGELIVGLKFDNLSVANDFHYTYENNTYHFVNVKNQKLNNLVYVRFIDKGLTSIKEYKKYVGLTTMECIKTGKPSSCCSNNTTKRIYHITI